MFRSTITSQNFLRVEQTWCIATVAKDREADIINVGRMRYPDIIGPQHKGWDEGSKGILQS
jgi:hypothetical protein